jgi:hypothetical protein
MTQPLHAASDTRLLQRVHGEYMEMPGLRLTIAQACRLWNVDAATSLDVLSRLVDEQFLLDQAPALCPRRRRPSRCRASEPG